MDPVRLVMYVTFLIRTVANIPILSTSASTATAGFDFSFICTTSIVRILFSNDKQVNYCKISGIDENGNCILGTSCPTNNKYSCNSTRQTYMITIPGVYVDDSIHGLKWKCGNVFGSSISDEVEVDVNFPIKEVNIRAIPIDESKINIVKDNTQQFNCTTDAGRPSPSIQWYISGTAINGPITSMSEVCTDCKVSASSTLLYVGNIDDDGKNIYCTAFNIENLSVRSQNRTVAILYGPSTVTISPSLLSYNVTETSGSIPAITCKADDCKPDCKVTWSGPNINAATESVLNLQNINRNQAGLYICNASNVAWSKTSSTVNVTVKYGPNNVNIYPSNLEYNVPQTTGNIGPINCTADCYPKCRMSWNGPNIPSDITSVLSLYGIDRNQTGSYQCTATNIVGSHVSATVIVIVQYGPQQVIISPSTYEYTVTELTDNVGPINCTSDCEPECIITWSGLNVRDISSSVLNIEKINRNQAGSYWCTAANNISSHTSSTVNIIVHYSPNEVTISPPTEMYIVTENTGSIDPIHCISDCKPDCTMTWTGPHIPVNTTSALVIHEIQKTQAGNYTCIASNEVGKKESISIRIVVLYGPDYVNIFPYEKYYTVNETNSVGPISCTSECKPKCIMKWIGPNIPIGNSSVLDIKDINRIQTGNYKCIASNEVGNKTSLNINIIVNFRPAVNDISGNQIYKENDTVTLSCDVDSIPRASVRWIFEDTFIDNDNSITVNTSANYSFLNIHPAGCLSMGTYNCTAMNIIGQDTKAIDIDIFCSPRMNDLEYNVSTLIAVKDQEPLNITVPLIAFPKPYIYWLFDNNNSSINVTHKTSNTIIRNRVFSHLYIANLTEADFGFYSVFAFNGIEHADNFIRAFEVIPERKPNPPNSVSCVGRTDSVLVYWTSNFDGGDTQIFHIYLRKGSDTSFYVYDRTYVDPGQHSISEATVNKLESDRIYHFKVRASNKHNYSMSEPVSCNTTSTVVDDQSSANTVAIGAGTGIAAAISILIVIAVVFLFIRRRKNNDKLEQDKELIKRSAATDENNDEDGLRDNPLYASSAQDVGAVYSTVDKRRQNNQDKDKLAVETTLYTQVVKTTKKGSNIVQASKQKKKSKQNCENNKTEMGCVYENSEDICHAHADDVYANSDVKHMYVEKDVYSPKKNKDGLIYADLDLVTAEGGKRFQIRGLENKNNYAIIDLTKTAEPLPSDSDNDDDQIEKNTENK